MHPLEAAQCPSTAWLAAGTPIGGSGKWVFFGSMVWVQVLGFRALGLGGFRFGTS